MMSLHCFTNDEFPDLIIVRQLDMIRLLRYLHYNSTNICVGVIVYMCDVMYLSLV